MEKTKPEALVDDAATGAENKKGNIIKQFFQLLLNLIKLVIQPFISAIQDCKVAETYEGEDLDLVPRAQHKSDMLRIVIFLCGSWAIVHQFVTCFKNNLSFNSDNFWNVILIIIELLIMSMYYFHSVSIARHNELLKMPWQNCKVYDDIKIDYFNRIIKPFRVCWPWCVNIFVIFWWVVAIVFFWWFVCKHLKSIQIDTLIIFVIIMVLSLQGVLATINFICFILTICHKSKEEINSIPHDAEYPSHSLLIETLTKNAHFFSVMYLSVAFLYSILFLISFVTNLNFKDSVLPELMEAANINHGIILLYYSAPVILGLIPFCISSIIPRHCINNILNVWKEKSLTEKYIDLQNGTGDKEELIKSISRLKGDKIEYRFSIEHALVITTIIANLATLLTFAVPYI